MSYVLYFAWLSAPERILHMSFETRKQIDDWIREFGNEVTIFELS